MTTLGTMWTLGTGLHMCTWALEEMSTAKFFRALSLHTISWVSEAQPGDGLGYESKRSRSRTPAEGSELHQRGWEEQPDPQHTWHSNAAHGTVDRSLEDPITEARILGVSEDTLLGQPSREARKMTQAPASVQWDARDQDQKPHTCTYFHVALSAFLPEQSNRTHIGKICSHKY